MDQTICAGDLVLSKSGRDKGNIFLVIEVLPERVTIADGKMRKIGSLKRKNLKHLSLLISQADISLAERIREGVPTSNERLHRRISELSQKLEEE